MIYLFISRYLYLQDLMRLNEAKERLCADFNREPTVAEWAQAVGMSCHDLQSSLLTGIQSRDRLVYANFLLVVHIARQYEGKGLSIQDLLQVHYSPVNILLKTR